MAAPIGFAVVVQAEWAQKIRKNLQSSSFWDSSRRLKSLSLNRVAIPVVSDKLPELQEHRQRISVKCSEFHIVEMHLPPSKKSLIISPYANLKKKLCKLLEENDIAVTDNLKAEIPGHWEKHGDLCLFQMSAFESEIWSRVCQDHLWKTVAECLSCKRLAKKSSVSTDGYRTPQVTLLLGNNGWVEQVDNGIRYAYDVTKCMFSSGNITEKLRIAKLDCRGETVVDLYAGIGYFTLPYLVHAAAEHVHACEWNPAAVDALRKNLQLNNVQDRCTVHYGDNKEVCPRGLADRVNLGLIPSSEGGWFTACRALNPLKGGVLHVHNNVTIYNQGKAKENHGERSSINRNINRPDSDSGPNDHDSEKYVRDDHAGMQNGTKMDHNISRFVEVIDNGIVMNGNANIEDAGKSCFDSSSVKNREVQTCCLSEVNDDNNDSAECCSASKAMQWRQWSLSATQRCSDLLFEIHNKPWNVNLLHIEHVKSYAPHIDHIVVDLDCRPIRTDVS